MPLGFSRPLSKTPQCFYRLPLDLAVLRLFTLGASRNDNEACQSVISNLSPMNERGIVFFRTFPGALRPLVLPGKNNMKMMSLEQWWNDIQTGENRSTGKKSCHSANSFAVDLKWTELGSNLGQYGERPSTERLRRGT
jgi:hypothetical protein